MRRLLFFTILALIGAREVRAQTAPSHRIRGLSEDLAGIVDDYLTDVFLNPARVGRLQRPQVHFFNQVNRFNRITYPFDARVRRFDATGGESDVRDYTLSPIGAAFFGTLGSLAFALSAEVDFQNDDRVDDQQEDSFVGTVAETRFSEVVRINDEEFYRLSLDLGSRGDATLLGARVQGSYTSIAYGFGSGYLRNRFLIGDPSQLSTGFNSSTDLYEFKRLRASASVAVARPGSVLSDLVVGGGPLREEFDANGRDLNFDDNDADGDGTGINGGPNSADKNELVYNSMREYDGYHVFGRLHTQLSDRVRTTHSLEFQSLQGDGTGTTRLLEQSWNFPDKRDRLEAGFTRDGQVDSWLFTTTVGYHEMIAENVLIAGAVAGVFERRQYDENGVGLTTVEFSGVDNGIQGTFTSPYSVKYARTIEAFHVRVPLGLEWTPHRFISIRVGATFYAQKLEDDRSYAREASGLPANMGSEVLDDVVVRIADLDNHTGVTFSNGLTLNVNDRVIVDLFTRSNNINLANYAYVAGRFRF